MKFEYSGLPNWPELKQAYAQGQKDMQKAYTNTQKAEASFTMGPLAAARKLQWLPGLTDAQRKDAMSIVLKSSITGHFDHRFRTELIGVPSDKTLSEAEQLAITACVLTQLDAMETRRFRQLGLDERRMHMLDLHITLGRVQPTKTMFDRLLPESLRRQRDNLYFDGLKHNNPKRKRGLNARQRKGTILPH